MALAPYTVTALAESDDQGTDGKNIIVGAVVSAAALVGGATATLYDDAIGSNPSTTKTTGANGQVTFYIEEGQYTLTVNGADSEISLLEADDAKVILANSDTQITPTLGFDLYHTGNTGVLDFSGIAPLPNTVTISNSIGKMLINRLGTSGSQIDFYNDNGQVGSISTSGVSTSYNTSSDNELKTVIGKPTDEQIDQKFNDIFDCFTLFDWKNGGNDQPVWGFLAWDVIDKGLDFGSEREGGKQNRALKIGDVYERIPATFDDEGNELTPEVEKTITPAGVDQSKVVPYLVAKIEQLERRLAAIGG